MNTYHMARKRTGRRERNSRLAGLFLVVLLIFALLPTRPAFAQSSPPVYTFPECENVDEEFLSSELDRISKLTFEAEEGSLDIGELVRKNWAELNLDADVDLAVDTAIQQMLQDEGYLSRLLSAWYPAKAEEFAERVSTAAFDSPIFRDAIARHSEATALDLSEEIQRMMVVTASAAILCVEEFIGVTFSETMAHVLEGNSESWRKEISSPEFRTDIREILSGSRSDTVKGGAILIGSQFTKVLVKKLARGIVKNIVTRILGKAASAVIPVIGQVVGVALIVWDLWDAREGALPEIGDEMKKEGVKEDIRLQITAEIEARIAEASQDLTESVSKRIYAQWEDFLQGFEHVLRLAERNPRFREIVDGLTANQVGKLAKLAAVCEDAIGTAWCNEIIESGDFERIRALPEDSFEILRKKADPDLVLSWADLAGNLIIQVVETELYLNSSPLDFGDRESVAHVLDLEDAAVIKKLMNLETTERNSLLRLPTNQTKWVLEKLTTEESIWLSSYLERLSSLSQKQLMDFAMRDRRLMTKLHSSQVLQSQFQWVVALATESQAFRRILNDETSDEVGKLSALVVTSVSVLEPQVFSLMIDSGQFEEIFALPRPAFAILRDQKDPNVVIEWGNLAGGRLGQVVTTGLYRLADPWSVGSKVRLERVLAIEHRDAVKTLLKLSRVSQDRALELPTDLAREFLTSLPDDHLAWVAEYLTELGLEEAELMADFALTKPDALPILAVSHNFRLKLPGVLTLSERNPYFRDILDETATPAIEKLANLTAIAMEVLPREVLEAELKNGRFKRVSELPESSFDILREKGDVSVVIDWAALALERIKDVVATLIYKFFSPADFSSRDLLYKTLDLEDREAIEILSQFSELQRVVLQSLSTEIARSALLSFSNEDLAWLAIFIADLVPTEKDPVVSYLLERPELLPDLRGRGDLNSRFPRLILLSLDVPHFRSILDSTPAESIAKPSALVSASDAAMTADELRAMIDSGQFEAVLSLPEEAFEILREKGDPDVVLAWADLAGEAIVRVVEAGLYAGEVQPGSFTGREELEKVLDLGNPVAMQKVMTLGIEVRETILRLPSREAKEVLVAEIPGQTLEWLAGYMNGLRPPVQQLLGRLVVEKPGLAEELESSEVLTSNFTRVLEGALELSQFREILDATRVDTIAKLTELLVIAEEELLPEEVVGMIESGQFETILTFPRKAFEILKEKKDPPLVIQWAELAGDSLVQVVETGLHKESQPEKFQDKGELDAVLALLEHENIREALLGCDDIKSCLDFLVQRIKDPVPWWPTAAMLTAFAAVAMGDLPVAFYSHYYLTPSLVLLVFFTVVAVLAVVLIRRSRKLVQQPS